MRRTNRHILLSALLGAGLALGAGCGDDDTKSTTKDTTVAPDTSQPETIQPDTTQPETVVPDTTAIDTAQAETEVAPEVNNECSPETADKGFVGAPCSKDCECQQNVNGLPLFCYKSWYMEGFGFCTDKATNRNPSNDLQEGDGVDTLSFVPDCFPDVPPAEVRALKLYAKACNSLADCKAIGSQYTHCGTAGLASWAPGGRGTYAPDIFGFTCTLSINNTCLIDSVPPFDGSLVE